MLELQTLTFNNIGRFITEQTIDFTNRDKLIQIDGKRLATGGSSGAGKSTIIMALNYLLGINDIPATVLQSRLTKKSLYASGSFLSNGMVITITRDKKEGLTVITPQETISGNNDLAEEAIDRIIKIPRSLFKEMIHKKQKERGFFLKMKPKETYQFLIKVLGLEGYLQQIDGISSKTKDIQEKIDKIAPTIEFHKTSIKEFEDLLQSKVLPTCDVTEEQIKNLDTIVFGYYNQINTKNNEKQQELKAIPIPQKIPSKFDRVLIQSLISQKTELSKQKNKIIQGGIDQKNHIKDLIREGRGQLENISRAKQETNRKAREVQQFKQEYETIVHGAACPTCNQLWKNELSVQKSIELNNKIQQNVQDVLKYKQIIEQEPTINTTINDLIIKVNQPDDLTCINEISNKIIELDSRILSEQAKELNLDRENENIYLKQRTEYLNKSKQVEDKYNNIVNEIKNLYDTYKNQLTELRTKYSNFTNRLREYNNEIGVLQNSLKEKNESIVTLEKNSIELKQGVLVATESQRLIKSYTLQIFQDTLDSIGERATEILNGIPNTSNISIYFENCKENKNGTLKDEISPMVSMDGEIGIPLKSFSGGEETGLDLCVDLAVIDIIEQKSNQGFNLFILDEPFDGLDSVCRESCLAILKQVDTNKKIIIVDHCEELKAMVTDIITVVRDNETSTIQN